ncbi:unnamed protein product [Rotaria sp. Silwood2]|nr:unnamed protein product [Rotaria sp. Silwood2]CAF4244013.1 unnamed protein product [Rotaria sp. Silwood2]
MNSIKRQSSTDELYGGTSKKLPMMLEGKSKSIINIEALSNEIFYEIFEYLDGCHIYKAFSNLNTRFQQFFINPFIPLKFKLFAYEKSDLEDLYKYMIIPNKHIVISLSLLNVLTVKQFFSLYNIDFSFNRLQSLVLHGIKLDKLLPLLLGLTCLPQFFSLFIYLDDNSKDLTDLYQLIFNLPFLNYNKLVSNSHRRLISLPIDDIQQFTNIKYLFINHYCTCDNLFDILLYTPQLSRLNVKYLCQVHDIIPNEMPIILSNLTHITIEELDLPFDVFEIFITEITSTLQVLSIGIKSINFTYLNANRWEQLISQHIPYLSKFHFEYYEKIPSLSNEHHNLLKQFTTFFWIKQQLFFEIHIDTAEWSVEEIIFSIHPYRLPDLHPEHVLNSSILSSQGIQLVISSIDERDHDFLLNDYIKSIITSTNITCLTINSNMVSSCVLIEMLEILHNLDSLTILYSSRLLKSHGCSQKSKHHNLSTTTNITKVNMCHVTKIEQVNFILKFCSHIQHLQIECTNDIELSSLIRFIFIEKNAYIKDLVSLCLWIWKVNDDMIQILPTIVDDEQILHQYRIEHINDKIYLQLNVL